jgi:hypothetical protein
MAAIVDTMIMCTDGKERHLVVGQPGGGGGSYQVVLDRYYVGAFVHYDIGWTPCIETGLLYGDDIAAILDIINNDHGGAYR